QGDRPPAVNDGEAVRVSAQFGRKYGGRGADEDHARVHHGNRGPVAYVNAEWSEGLIVQAMVQVPGRHDVVVYPRRAKSVTTRAGPRRRRYPIISRGPPSRPTKWFTRRLWKRDARWPDQPRPPRPAAAGQRC